MISTILAILMFVSTSAMASEYSQCVAKYVVCVRDCTKDWKVSQKECEKPEKCGPLSQCDELLPKKEKTTFDTAGIDSANLQRCDEIQAEQAKDCEKIMPVKAGLQCLKKTVEDHKQCVLKGGVAPQPKAKPAVR